MIEAEAWWSVLINGKPSRNGVELVPEVGIEPTRAVKPTGF